MAQRKRAPRQQKASSHAWVWWLLTFLILGTVAYFNWPKLLQGTRGLAGRFGLTESAARPQGIASLRTICSGNVSYQYTHPKQGYARTLADLGPKEGGYINAALASGGSNGYRFEYIARPGKSGLIDEYRVTARLLPGAGPGEGNLYMDESCDIHVTKEDRAATASDPILK